MNLTRRAAIFGGLATLLAGCSGAGYEGPERTMTIAAGESGALPRVIGTEPADAEARGGRPNVLPVKSHAPAKISASRDSYKRTVTGAKLQQAGSITG